MTCGIWLTCQLLLEQYWVITHPCATFGRSVLAQAAATVGVSVLLRVPTFLELTVDECEHGGRKTF